MQSSQIGPKGREKLLTDGVADASNSCSSQCPYLEGCQLLRLRLCLLILYREFYSTLCTSLDQLFKINFVHCTDRRSQQPPQVCSDLTSVCVCVCVCVCGASAITRFLIFCRHITALPQSCSMFPVVPVLVFCQKKSFFLLKLCLFL